MDILSFMIMIMVISYIIVPSIRASNSISVSESLTEGKTLVSKGGQFELGFFSPGSSTRRYLGIWYKQMPIHKVVWVANRVNPINNTLGTLTLSTTGNLIIHQNDSLVWSTTSEKQVQKPMAELLDSGNLVIRNQEGTYLWQSFDYPSDTILPGMNLGWDLRNDFERRITSWKSPDDPSPGDLSWGLVLHNYPEFYLMQGTNIYCRIGPWNGLQFSGLSDQKQNAIYDFKYVANNDLNYVSNKDEIFYSFTLKNPSAFVSATISQTNFSISVWEKGNTNWLPTEVIPQDLCGDYAICGAYASCSSTNSVVCQCLPGFIPKSTQRWAIRDWSGGCVRNISLSCNNPQVDVDDVLLKYTSLEVPDTTHTLLYENIDLELCRTMCLNNCSCTAFTNSDISGKGSGCVMWFGDLIDIRKFDTGGQDLYIRMARVEIEETSNGRNKTTTSNGRNKTTIAATTAAVISGMLLFCIYVIYRVRRRISDKSKTEDNIEKHLEDMDLPLFNLQTISSATTNFLLNNKIGQGGFGSVYKGKLADGQEIAVKRLSSNSGQGITEFLTEVKLIAKLQHRNLVKLLGCCVGGQEKLLVYEYMVNGSLDSFIFDKINGKLLEWPQRFHIIFGIARGLVYLHQDSRLRIIHRDLKASNVLLDDKLNPKISDFGMARSFGGDQIEGNTNRVVGTYGYMAPEYAVDGQFSIKSDVFSFGVLLLEIICGNKNRALCHGNVTLNLVGYI